MRVASMLRRVVSASTRAGLAAYVPARTAAWPEASRLFVVGDGGAWVIDDLAIRLGATARRLGYEVGPASWALFARGQAVFQSSHFGALRPRWLESSSRLGLSYFHGRPGTAGHPEFDAAANTLRRHATRIERVQVTHAEMHELVVAAGVPEERVFRIPIGIDLAHFPSGGAESRARARRMFELPESAFVVGSFQKDGAGWGEGLEPKLVKGPDVLVAVLARLRTTIPELVVLLTGPARGYVRTQLERLGIPHEHRFLGSRDELAAAYHALDVYLVSSRQEGGPEAVLEAMATGTPLVTTRVGQAQELVADPKNGLLVEVDDVEGLEDAVRRVREDTALAERLRRGGRPTAEANADERLEGRWAELLDGFVRKAGSGAG